MKGFFFLFMIYLCQIVQSVYYSYDQTLQDGCQNISNQAYTIVVTNSSQCQINFTFKGTSSDSLQLNNVYLTNLQAINQFASLLVLSSTIQICLLDLNFTSSTNLFSVTILQADACYISQILLYLGSNLTLYYVQIYGKVMNLVGQGNFIASQSQFYISQSLIISTINHLNFDVVTLQYYMYQDQNFSQSQVAFDNITLQQVVGTFNSLIQFNITGLLGCLTIQQFNISGNVLSVSNQINLYAIDSIINTCQMNVTQTNKVTFLNITMQQYNQCNGIQPCLQLAQIQYINIRQINLKGHSLSFQNQNANISHSCQIQIIDSKIIFCFWDQIKYDILLFDNVTISNKNYKYQGPIVFQISKNATFKSIDLDGLNVTIQSDYLKIFDSNLIDCNLNNNEINTALFQNVTIFQPRDSINYYYQLIAQYNLTLQSVQFEGIYILLQGLKVEIIDSNFLLCFFNSGGQDNNIYNVTIQNDNVCDNSQLIFNPNQSLIIESIIIQSQRAISENEFTIQLQSNYISLLNSSLQNNNCYAQSMLQIVNFQQLIIESFIFNNNLMIQGSMLQIYQISEKYRNYNVTIYNLTFQQNQVIGGQLLSIGSDGINANFIDLHSITIQQNIIDNFLTNQTIMNTFYHDKMFQMSDLTSNIVLITVISNSNYNLIDTLILNNTFMFEISIILLYSQGSAPNIQNYNVENNNFQCLQLTIFQFKEEFGNNLSNFNFLSSNTREPREIIRLSVIFLENLELFYNKIISFDEIYSHTSSLTQTLQHNQFPILGIITMESQFLICHSFNIQLDYSTLFQILQSQNQIHMFSVRLSNINVSRESLREDFFDYGMFDIKGIFTTFQMDQFTATNLSLGNGNLVNLQSQDTFFSAQFNIMLQYIIITNCKLYILDNSKQISLISISNNIKQNITIKSLWIMNFTFFSFPSYQEEVQNYEFQDDSANKLNQFLSLKNQLLSLQPQKVILDIMSIYASVVLLDFNFKNISIEYGQYGIFIVSQNIFLKNLALTDIFLSSFDINLNYQQIMAFYVTNVVMQNIQILNVKSMINQVLFIEILGQISYVSIEYILFDMIQSIGEKDSLQRPIIQIQSKTASNLIIQIIFLKWNFIKNINQGGLLMITQLGQSITTVLLKNIIFNTIHLSSDTSIININLAKSKLSYVSLSEIFYKDQKNAGSSFNFLDIQQLGHLVIKKVFLKALDLKNALNLVNIKNIVVQNFKVLNSISLNNNNFIKIYNFTQVLFDQISINSIQSNTVSEGIVFFENPINTIQSQLIIQKMSLTYNQNMKCCVDFFLFVNVNHIIISNLTAFQNTNLTIFHLNNSQMNIDQSYFKSNLVFKGYGLTSLQQNGVILNAYESQLMVQRSVFFQSSGSNLGGAIYFFVESINLEIPGFNLFFGDDVIFSQCSAQVGGAVYHRSLNPSWNFKDVNWLGNEDYQNQFDNIASIPDSIYITLVETYDGLNKSVIIFTGQFSNSDIIQINDIKSGSYLNLYLQLKEGEQTHYDQIDAILNGWGQFQFSDGQYIFPSIQVKNLSNQQTLHISVINTIQNNYQLVGNLTILFNLSFRHCVPGEFVIYGQVEISGQIVSNSICKSCPNNTYSNINSEQCIDCPQVADCSDGTLFQLNKGWWRQNFSSSQLLQCDNSACQENRTTQQQCLTGFIGPICGQCDAKGIKWTGHYCRGSSNNCKECSGDSNAILLYILVGITIIASIQFQLVMSYGSNILQCIVRYVRIMGFLPLGTSGLFNANVYIKTIVFHFQVNVNLNQILSMLQGLLNNNVLSQIIEKQNIIGNQSQILIFAYDCIYGAYDLHVPSLAYLDVILALFYSLLIMIIGLLFSFVKLSDNDFRPNYRSFVILYSYWIQVPQVAFYISAAVSCRQIFQNYFVKADITQICLGSNHLFYLSSLLIPTLIFQILSGIIGLYFLKKNIDRLHLIKIQTLYGLLFQEYKIKYCYYEIIKLYVKLTVVFFINFFDDSLIIMALLISVVLLFYFYLTFKIQPYLSHQTQRIDQFQIITLIITIQLMTVSQNSSIYWIRTALFLIILIANMILTIFIVLNLLESYTKKLDKRQIYEVLIKFQPFFAVIFQKPRENNLHVYYNWKFLRSQVIISNHQINCFLSQTKKDEQPENILSFQYEDYERNVIELVEMCQVTQDSKIKINQLTNFD